jgi:hypothetical protein
MFCSGQYLHLPFIPFFKLINIKWLFFFLEVSQAPMSYFIVENCIMHLLLLCIASHLLARKFLPILQVHQKWQHNHNALALLVHLFV